eukprot:CAMPEP_0170603216 /NCGR_PEP_ID=MMETSP0224-20130122/18796_1 /TAXON_ID=285029 /ORGANISM="Togula jolla, Strain CCCM 725" /LENGTH=88 /DNA_ID=CAMNT_0010928087 /DNA_START=814 /DNA_END=1080 /DNA_ORIENTATION=+
MKSSLLAFVAARLLGPEPSAALAIRPCCSVRRAEAPRGPSTEAASSHSHKLQATPLHRKPPVRPSSRTGKMSDSGARSSKAGATADIT